MPVTELRVEGYRSIRDLTLSLKRANVIVGPNGCGKSNLYGSMTVLQAAAQGTLARTFAAEGGIPSVMWAGKRGKGPVRLKLGATVDEYEIDLEIGPPQNAFSAFSLDPYVKRETVTRREGRHRKTVLDRGTSTCSVLNAEGGHDFLPMSLHHAESAMAQIQDPGRYPLLDDLRRRITKWRFYHGFRTDADSPLRRPQVGVRTHVLASDGADLAAALQTIEENGDTRGLQEAFADAFPGARLEVSARDGLFEATVSDRSFERPLRASELSDGTLRYLALLAALLSPTPAPLLALNEPETSLHEDLLPPLARLLAKAAETNQIWLTTHSQILADALAELVAVKPIRLEKRDGETVLSTRPAGSRYGYGVDD